MKDEEKTLATQIASTLMSKEKGFGN